MSNAGEAQALEHDQCTWEALQDEYEARMAPFIEQMREEAAWAEYGYYRDDEIGNGTPEEEILDFESWLDSKMPPDPE